MALFAIRLDGFHVGNPRGKTADNDVVTFSIFVNQVERGRGAAMFTDIAADTTLPAGAAPPTTRSNIDDTWTVGPMEIAPGDNVTIVYTGTNTSDSEIDLSGQAALELKILDSALSAVAGAAGLGVIAGLVTSALSFLANADPIGALVGYRPQGPCNGPVFQDTVSFTGAGLAAVAIGPPSPNYVPLSSEQTESVFTRSYTDETSHNTSICGEVAHTDVSFTAIKLPWASVATLLWLRFPGGKAVRPISLRAILAPKGGPFSVRTVLGVV